MLAPRTATLVAASTLLAALPSALGHGYIVEPAAVWKQGYPSNGYGQTVPNLLWGPQDGNTYGYGPTGSVKYFETNFPKSKYKTLKDLIMGEQTVLTEYKSDAQCGLTTKDEAKRATLPATLKYSGFTHAGPCEVWCDNTKLAFANDCEKTYATGTIPIDTSKCQGADRLTIYWVAVHSEPWQVYTDCVYLKGGSGNAAAPAPGSAPAPATPSVTTAKPTAPAVATPSPVAGEASAPAPKPAVAKPSTNCKRNRNRE
jgi:hypothetical protein